MMCRAPLPPLAHRHCLIISAATIATLLCVCVALGGLVLDACAPRSPPSPWQSAGFARSTFATDTRPPPRPCARAGPRIRRTRAVLRRLGFRGRMFRRSSPPHDASSAFDVVVAAARATASLLVVTSLAMIPAFAVVTLISIKCSADVATSRAARRAGSHVALTLWSCLPPRHVVLEFALVSRVRCYAVVVLAALAAAAFDCLHCCVCTSPAPGDTLELVVDAFRRRAAAPRPALASRVRCYAVVVLAVLAAAALDFVHCCVYTSPAPVDTLELAVAAFRRLTSIGCVEENPGPTCWLVTGGVHRGTIVTTSWADVEPLVLGVSGGSSPRCANLEEATRVRDALSLPPPAATAGGRRARSATPPRDALLQRLPATTTPPATPSAATSPAPPRFWAVRIGRKCGVFLSWDDGAYIATDAFSGASHCRATSLAAAASFAGVNVVYDTFHSEGRPIVGSNATPPPATPSTALPRPAWTPSPLPAPRVHAPAASASAPHNLVSGLALADSAFSDLIREGVEGNPGPPAAAAAPGDAAVPPHHPGVRPSRTADADTQSLATSASTSTSQGAAVRQRLAAVSARHADRAAGVEQLLAGRSASPEERVVHGKPFGTSTKSHIARTHARLDAERPVSRAASAPATSPLRERTPVAEDTSAWETSLRAETPAETAAAPARRHHQPREPPGWKNNAWAQPLRDAAVIVASNDAAQRARANGQSVAAAVVAAAADAKKKTQTTKPAAKPATNRPPAVAAGPAAAADADAPWTFLERWLHNQHKTGVGAFLRLTETYTTFVNGVQSTPCKRLLVVNTAGVMSGHHGGISSRNQKVLDASIARASRLNAPGELQKRQNAKIVKLAQFTECQALVEATDTPFVYGVFPLEPGTSSTCGTFCSLGYTDYVTLGPDESIALHAKWSTALLASPSAVALRGQNWTVSDDTGDAVVDTVLGALGSTCPMLTRVPVGVLRQAFLQRASGAISGYANMAREFGASTDPARRAELRTAMDKLLRRLLAFPRMHCRQLVGAFGSKIRDAFTRQQLQGNVCTQAAPAATAAAPARAEAATPHDVDEAAVRSAFRLASEGLLGRASSALARVTHAVVDKAQQLQDLIELHPSGEPPTIRAHELPSADVFNENTFSPDDTYKFVRANLSGAAPGRDGWTYEMLVDCLESPTFANDFHAMMIDICNGRVAPDTRLVLAASGLVPLPKGPSREDGTRPIALGSVILKVAASRAVTCAKAQLDARFRGTQFGCAVKGGAEKIVHTVRRFIREAKSVNGAVVGPDRVVVTLDFANAFNSPTRQAMWEATKHIPELAGIFCVSYESHSDLYVSGSDAVIASERGARQGTVDGPVIFSLALQSVLTAAAACEGVEVMAYLDDITILARSPAHAETAVALIMRLAAVLGMQVKKKKCEVMSANETFAIAPNSCMAGPAGDCFRVVRVLKLLGASVAIVDIRERDHLFDRMKAIVDIFCRRAKLGASPQIFEVLRLCGVPKLNYHLRTHNPLVSRQIAAAFDEQIERVISHWASISTFTPSQLIVLQLPRNRGGFGLTRASFIAPAAYTASYEAAFGARHVRSQATLADVFTEHLLAAAALADPTLKHHLEVHALTGSDAALSCVTAKVHPDVYGAELRTRLAGDADSSGSCTSMECPGCKLRFFKSGPWGQHASSCVVLKGGLVTLRHNAVVGFLRSLLAEGGYSPEMKEPRDLATYTCCGLPMSQAMYKEHKPTCTAPPLQVRTSGPDIRFALKGKIVVADVTVINVMCALYANGSADDAIASAEAMKMNRYGAVCAAAGVELMPLVATANGHLSPKLVQLVKTVSQAAFRDWKADLQRLSALVSYGGGRTRLAAEAAKGIRPASVSIHNAATVRAYAVSPLPADKLALLSAGLLATPATPAELNQAASMYTQQNIAARDLGLQRLLAIATTPEFIAVVLAACRARATAPAAAAAADTADADDGPAAAGSPAARAPGASAAARAAESEAAERKAFLVATTEQQLLDDIRAAALEDVQRAEASLRATSDRIVRDLEHLALQSADQQASGDAVAAELEHKIAAIRAQSEAAAAEVADIAIIVENFTVEHTATRQEYDERTRAAAAAVQLHTEKVAALQAALQQEEAICARQLDAVDVARARSVAAFDAQEQLTLMSRSRSCAAAATANSHKRASLSQLSSMHQRGSSVCAQPHFADSYAMSDATVMRPTRSSSSARDSAPVPPPGGHGPSMLGCNSEFWNGTAADTRASAGARSAAPSASSQRADSCAPSGRAPSRATESCASSSRATESCASSSRASASTASSASVRSFETCASGSLHRSTSAGSAARGPSAAPAAAAATTSAPPPSSTPSSSAAFIPIQANHSVFSTTSVGDYVSQRQERQRLQKQASNLQLLNEVAGGGD